MHLLKMVKYNHLQCIYLSAPVKQIRDIDGDLYLKELLHDEHQWCPRISQMLESTHDNSKPVVCQLKLPDNPVIADLTTFKKKSSTFLEIYSQAPRTQQHIRILVTIA